MRSKRISSRGETARTRGGGVSSTSTGGQRICRSPKRGRERGKPRPAEGVRDAHLQDLLDLVLEPGALVAQEMEPGVAGGQGRDLGAETEVTLDDLVGRGASAVPAVEEGADLAQRVGEEVLELEAEEAEALAAGGVVDVVIEGRGRALRRSDGDDRQRERGGGDEGSQGQQANHVRLTPDHTRVTAAAMATVYWTGMSRRDDVSLRYVAARREARLVAFAIDGLTLAALAVPFLAVAGLAVLLQSDWLAVDPSGGEWAVGYGIALSWLVAPLIYVTLGTVSGGDSRGAVAGTRDPAGGRRGAGRPAGSVARGVPLYVDAAAGRRVAGQPVRRARPATARPAGGGAGL